MSHTSIPGPTGSLHVDDGGSGGVPVVFVHSFAGSTEHWSKQLEHLRKTRRAVAFDLRGHGRSSPARSDDYTVVSLARDVAAVADTLHLDRFVLVGHSLGGAAAAAYAGTHPDRLAGVLLAEAPGRSSASESQPVVAALEKDFDATMASSWKKLLTNARPEVSQRIEREMRSIAPDVSMRVIREVFAFDPIGPLGRFSGPKLAVTTSAAGTPRDLHQQASGFAHEAVTGTSHWMQMDKPEEFNRILDAFLARVDHSERQGSDVGRPLAKADR